MLYIGLPVQKTMPQTLYCQDARHPLSHRCCSAGSRAFVPGLRADPQEQQGCHWGL